MSDSRSGRLGTATQGTEPLHAENSHEQRAVEISGRLGHGGHTEVRHENAVVAVGASGINRRVVQASAKLLPIPKPRVLRNGADSQGLSNERIAVAQILTGNDIIPGRQGVAPNRVPTEVPLPRAPAQPRGGSQEISSRIPNSDL